MKISEAINAGLYGHIKDGAKITEQVIPLNDKFRLRVGHIAANPESFELALSQTAHKAILPRLANQQLDENDELNTVSLPRVRVAVKAASNDLIKSLEDTAKQVSNPREFKKGAVFDIRKRMGRILQVLNEISEELI